MPTDTTASPTVPTTAVAPTPGKPYNLSEHAPTAPASRNPALTEALNRRAGIRTDPAPSGDNAKFIPSQPPRALLDAPAPTPETKPAKPTTPDKPAPHVKFIAADEREPAATTPTPPDSKPPTPSEPAPEVLKSAPAQLREAYERLKTDFATRVAEGDLTRKQLTEFQAKAKSYEDRIKTLESADVRAKELEKQLLTYDEQLRVTNYLQHPEFHEKFVKPVAEAMQSAAAVVKDLMVEQPDGNVRTGTEQDFHAVLGQPNTTLAFKKAQELFGQEFATLVVEERNRVLKAQKAQADAVKDAGLKSQEWLKSQQERAAAERDTARIQFAKVAESIADRYKEIYRPPNEDQEAIAAHQSGKELAELIVNGRPEDMPQERYLENVAKLYHRAASWPMHQLNITRLQKQVETLTQRLSAYEKSSPDTSSRQQPGGVTQDAGGTIVTKAGELEAKMRASLERRAGVRR